MSDLYNEVGARTYANLLADPMGADLTSVPLTPDVGVIPVGCILEQDPDTKLYAPVNALTRTSAVVVAKEEVDTTDVEAADMAAYRAGCFVRGAVFCLDSGTKVPLTAANEALLQMFGIVFDAKDSTESFPNGGE